MEAVEVRFGRGDKRRTLGWLVVGQDGFLRYESQAMLDRKVFAFVSANYEAYWD